MRRRPRASRRAAASWLAVATLACCHAGPPSPVTQVMVSSEVLLEAAPLASTLAARGPLALRLVSNRSGAAAWCEGRAAVAVLSRPLRDAERATCEALHAGGQVRRLPRAALALWAPQGEDWIRPLTPAELRRLLTDPEQGGARTWSEVHPSLPSLPVVVFAPPPTSEALALLAAGLLAPGHRLRPDLAVGVHEGTALIAAHVPSGAVALAPPLASAPGWRRVGALAAGEPPWAEGSLWVAVASGTDHAPGSALALPELSAPSLGARARP